MTDVDFCPVNSRSPRFSSTSWQETVVLLHSLFPWQLSQRARPGFSGRQSAAPESLFTAWLQLWYSLTCFTSVSPLCHVYFKPSHREVHNYSLHGDDVGRVTDWTSRNSAIIQGEGKKKKKLSSLFVAGGTRVNIKELHVQRSAPRFICKYVFQG